MLPGPCFLFYSQWKKKSEVRKKADASNGNLSRRERRVGPQVSVGKVVTTDCDEDEDADGVVETGRSD